MKPFWIIEEFERDNSFEELAQAAERHGCQTHITKYVPFDEGILDKFSSDPQCVLFQGSIQFCRKVQKYRPQWVPGVWCSWDQYECLNYYAHWGKYLFNNDYIMMPLAEVARRKDDLLGRNNGKFFMRPSGGDKSFTGTVIDPRHQTWDEWGFIMNETELNELVIVAETKPIHKEWRVICTEVEAVTGSRYKTHGKADYKREFPDEVRDYAYKILNETEWRPDPMFVMDICEGEDGSLHLLEIGALSCAGLYHCDLDKIVEAACEIAIGEYKDVYEQ